MQEGNVKQGGFRTLSQEEITAVSGGFDDFINGGIVVTAASRGGSGSILGDGGSSFGSGIENSETGSEHISLADGGGEIVVSVNRYVPGQDYCTLSPDSILGVDISSPCYIHDIAYGSESDQSRYDADLDFLVNINNMLVEAGVDAITAAAYTYFQGVRSAGIFFYEGSGFPG